MKNLNRSTLLKVLPFVLVALLTSCRKYTDYPGVIRQGESNGWIRVSTLPAQKISVLEVIENKVYAATAAGLIYRSADSGKTWNTLSKSWNSTKITTLTKYKNKIIVGTEADGIYMSPDDGNTWLATFPFPSRASVTSLVTWNNHLYCSSVDLDGVFSFDDNTFNWSMFNNAGMPGNYNLSVEKTIVVGNSLFSVKGANGNFYTYDTSAATWNEHFFATSYVPGLRITDLLLANNVLYASYGRAILRSENNGANWVADTVGLKKANDIISPTRTLYAGSSSVYTLLNVGSYETWIQQRPIAATTGTSWAANQEHLSIGYSYDFCQFGTKLFLATETGLYWKDVKAL